MKTYTDCKPLVHNPSFRADRQTVLDSLVVNLIDFPLITLINKINKLPYLFTLQCCHGHFLYKDGIEISDFKLAKTGEWIEYRLAYIALCIENSPSGRTFKQELMNVPLSIDRENIQFCSAQWFWDQWLNSYAIQVMPKRFKDLDTAQIDSSEARRIAKVRDDLFAFLKEFIAQHFW